MRPRIVQSSALLLLFLAAPLCPAEEDFKPSRDLSEDGLKAYTVLTGALTFGVNRPGIAGGDPDAKDPEWAFKLLLDEERAEDVFLRLTKLGSAAGKLYGLEGLHHVNSTLFDKAAKSLEKESSLVTFGQVGCCLEFPEPSASLRACVKKIIKQHKAEEKKEKP